MLMVAQQHMKATMTELEQANIAVEVAKKKKVEPGTGLASDVTMLVGTAEAALVGFPIGARNGHRYENR